jgi:hypothetical protein
MLFGTSGRDAAGIDKPLFSPCMSPLFTYPNYFVRHISSAVFIKNKGWSVSLTYHPVVIKVGLNLNSG